MSAINDDTRQDRRTLDGDGDGDGGGGSDGDGDGVDVVVIGGMNTDYLVRGDTLPGPGETVEGDEFQTGPGGKGANQAVGVARLGLRVAFVARRGDDARGEDIAAALVRESVDVSHVAVDADQPTGVALVLVERSGEKQILTAPGANRRLTDDDVRAASPALASAKVVLACFEVPVSAVATAFRAAKDRGAMTVLDPAPPAKPGDVDGDVAGDAVADLLAVVDVIRPNAAEAEALTGIEVRDRDSAEAAARALLDRGVGAAVVQAGDEGDLLVTPDEVRLLARIEVDTVDATGAGDAFAAALAVGLAEGMPLGDAAAFANAAAALATTKLGAQPGLPRRADVDALLARRTV